MDFGLSEEQEMLQETIRGFAQNECPTTRLRELFDEGEGHDPKLWSALAEMGIAGLIVPEDHGGAGMEILDLALVAEVLGEFAIPGPFLGHSLAIRGVMLAGSASFATPIGYQTNTFVYRAGNYRFVDFVRIGLPLNLILWGVAAWLVPVFWPL